MSDKDGVGTPIWKPKVIDGGQEKKSVDLPDGARFVWNVVGGINESDTEFAIRFGSDPVKFKLIGSPSDARTVVGALLLAEKVERNAMRLALQSAKNNGVDLSKDASVSTYDESEREKLDMFVAWLSGMGAFLLSTGKRPWDGKISKENEGNGMAQFSIIKNEGGTKDESEGN